MELEGRFTSSNQLADVIRQAGQENFSGNLTIFSGKTPTELLFHSGRLTGSGNQGRQRKLGQILLSRGLIERTALEEALAYQHDFAPGTPLGKVLVFRGRISEEGLRQAINMQLEEELSDLLMHEEGSFQFLEKDHRGADEPLTELDTIALVDTIMARRAEWEQIRVRITHDNVIPAVVKITDHKDRELLSFSAPEWQVLSLVNGYYDVNCIAARSGLGRFETYRCLANFIGMGLVELRRPTETDAIPPEPGQHDTPPSGVPRDNKDATEGSRWSGILQRIRDPDEESGTDDPDNPGAATRQFHSPVSFVSAMANSILFKLLSNPDFIVDPADERLAERYWRQMLMRFPRADLVLANGNLLDADSFDRYIKTLGVQGAMKSIYLETLEALNRYMHTLYLLSAQRLGTKTARNVFINGMEDMRKRSNIENGDTFFFKEFAAKVLE